MEQSRKAEVICDFIRGLEAKIDGLEQVMRDLIQSNKDLKNEYNEMKVKVNDFIAEQDKVNTQLDLLLKNIGVIKFYFPTENVENLLELEQETSDNEENKAVVRLESQRHKRYNKETESLWDYLDPKTMLKTN